MDDENEYSFASRPRAVHNTRTKYRPKDDIEKNDKTVANIMYDSRIVRGSTYAQVNQIQTMSKTKSNNSDSPVSNSSTLKLRRRVNDKSMYNRKLPKYKHIPVPLDKHLIEQTNLTECNDSSTQTDKFIQFEADKEFIPPKTGIDASTQIEENDNLFKFDKEVDPLLQVICNKTMEQALMEVEEELELHHLKSAISDITNSHEIQLQYENQALETKAKAFYAQKTKFMHEKEVWKKEIDDIHQKMAALNVSRVMLPQCYQKAWKKLENDGVLYDPIQNMLDKEFFEYVYNQADEYIAYHRLSESLCQDLVSNVFMVQKSIQYKHDNNIKEGKIRLLVQGRNLGTDSIGPIHISTLDTLGDVENKIQNWMECHVGKCEKPEEGYIQLAFGANTISCVEDLLAL